MEGVLMAADSRRCTQV